MKVRMLRTEFGADSLANGVTLGGQTYVKDGVYDLGDFLGKVFIEIGAAVIFEQKQPEENKMMPEPENKKKKPGRPKKNEFLRSEED